MTIELIKVTDTRPMTTFKTVIGVLTTVSIMRTASICARNLRKANRGKRSLHYGVCTG